MAGKPRYTDDQIAFALEQTKGDRSAAAKLIGCSRATVHRYTKLNPQGRDWVKYLLDRGEQMVYQIHALAMEMALDDPERHMGLGLRAARFYGVNVLNMHPARFTEQNRPRDPFLMEHRAPTFDVAPASSEEEWKRGPVQ